jgi:predicted Ser/Thr protein kinase
VVEVLQRKKAGDLPQLREAFSNKMVLIGIDSQQEVKQDVGTTPFADATPGLLVHANVLDNLLRGRFLQQAPTGPYLAALGILAAFFGWMFSTRSVPASVLLAALALAVMAGADLALFAGWAIDVPPFTVLALAPMICIATGGFRYVFLERHSREREADLREGRIVQQELLPESLIGQTLSHYQILARLGGGGMGIVYLGRDKRLNRDVAIKVLPGRALADERARRRFRREALALSKLSHPHIASIYDFDSQDGVDFIAMEFVAGMALSDRIRRGSLPEREAVVIAIQIVEALVEAHAHGVIHRDLKPANVVLSAKGEAKVLDFGLARFARAATDSETVSDSITEPNQVMGTIAYMPPEVLRGERADERSDLYSVGVVLYEMLTGRRPFRDEEPHELYFTILSQPPSAPSVLNARVSTGAESIVLQALEKDSSRRPQSARELLAQLRSLAAHSDSSLVR